MSAQDRTLDQYHHLMQINAASHLIRAARQLGLFGQLREGQRTLDQLGQALALEPGPLGLLLDSLVAIGIVENYQDDYALSRAAHLLCQYDEDLGDQRWDRLVQRLRGQTKRHEIDDQHQFNHLAATQWIHTPAAVQAAEILDIGGDREVESLRILDLGCGSAVWSCAMAHREPAATIMAVDGPGALQAACSTANSIGLGERFEPVESDPQTADLPADAFDLVLLAQRVACLAADAAEDLVRRAVGAAKPGGRVAVIDLFRGPTRPNLAESIEALRLELDTGAGHMRSLEEIQRMLRDLGLQSVQFAFLAASKVNLGIAVGVKPETEGR